MSHFLFLRKRQKETSRFITRNYLLGKKDVFLRWDESSESFDQRKFISVNLCPITYFLHEASFCTIHQGQNVIGSDISRNQLGQPSLLNQFWGLIYLARDLVVSFRSIAVFADYSPRNQSQTNPICQITNRITRYSEFVQNV